MRITIDIDGDDGSGPPHTREETKTSGPSRVALSELDVADIHDAGAAPAEANEQDEDVDPEVTYFLEEGMAPDASGGEAPS